MSATPTDSFLACAYCDARVKREAEVPAGWILDKLGRAVCPGCKGRRG